jgi:hypothetical protein
MGVMCVLMMKMVTRLSVSMIRRMTLAMTMIVAIPILLWLLQHGVLRRHLLWLLLLRMRRHLLSLLLGFRLGPRHGSISVPKPGSYTQTVGKDLV